MEIETTNALRFLAAKGMSVDFRDVARLLTGPEVRGESVRRQIARDYYRHTGETR